MDAVQDRGLALRRWEQRHWHAKTTCEVRYPRNLCIFCSLPARPPARQPARPPAWCWLGSPELCLAWPMSDSCLKVKQVSAAAKRSQFPKSLPMLASPPAGQPEDHYKQYITRIMAFPEQVRWPWLCLRCPAFFAMLTVTSAVVCRFAARPCCMHSCLYLFASMSLP